MLDVLGALWGRRRRSITEPHIHALISYIVVEASFCGVIFESAFHPEFDSGGIRGINEQPQVANSRIKAIGVAGYGNQVSEHAHRKTFLKFMVSPLKSYIDAEKWNDSDFRFSGFQWPLAEAKGSVAHQRVARDSWLGRIEPHFAESSGVSNA